MLSLLILLVSSPVGMILQSGGPVEVRRNGTVEQLQVADVLYAGDHIAVGEQSAVLVFCPTMEKLRLRPNTRLALAADKIEVSAGELDRTRAPRCTLPRVALGESSLERVGGLRLRGYPPVAVYLGGKISTRRPEFNWASVADADRYVLTLRDDLGRVVWEQSTTELSLVPEAPLEDGRSYQWEVRAEKDGRILAHQSAALEVSASEDLSSSILDDQADAILLALELQNAGYYAEAAAYFRRLREEDAGDERLTRHLAWLYWEAGLIQAANVEKARLAGAH